MEKRHSSARLSLQEPLSKMFTRATSLFKLPIKPVKAPALDGEIVYCKNNVCVHHSGIQTRVPGYLSLRCSVTEQSENQNDSTLILHWVPNATICDNPKSVDSPLGGSSRNSSEADLIGLTDDSASSQFNRSVSLPTNSDHSSDTDKTVSDTSHKGRFQGDVSVKYIPTHRNLAETPNSAVVEDLVVISSHSGYPNGKHDYQNDIRDDTEVTTSLNANVLPSTIGALTSGCDIVSVKRPVTLSLSHNLINTQTGDKHDCADSESLISSSTGGPDSDGSLSVTSTSEISSMCDIRSLTETAESIAESHNLMFPADAASRGHELKQSSVNPSTSSSSSKPSVFSVNLATMRSLRLFFSDESTNSGQLVIASRESQYKIFHFNNGGLDKLAEILEEWNLFHSAKRNTWHKGVLSPFSRQFRVVRPSIGEQSELHPEESMYQELNAVRWRQFMNERGQIGDELSLKKTVFFGGIEPSLRKDVWPFLLQYYPYDSTFDQRDQIRNDKYLRYHKIKKKREKLSRDEVWKAKFWRAVQNTVEKDVVRTDRSHTYYKGEGNANVEVLKEILLNYAVAHPHLGYTQGMSDLLSPILVELMNESDAYWCFEGLMQRTIFFSQPKDHDMDRQLLYLKELLRLMFPKFYQHLMKVGDALGLLFVHRWILLCFKREFVEQDALAVWETCWANVQTNYFHLFVALAIVTSYSDDVLQDELPADEMLLHFSNLSHHMNGKLIISKARGLMHQFRLLEKIPCTLQDLCSTCSAGMWDSGHAPAVECIGHESIAGCPYLGVSLSKESKSVLHLD